MVVEVRVRREEKRGRTGRGQVKERQLMWKERMVKKGCRKGWRVMERIGNLKNGPFLHSLVHQSCVIPHTAEPGS